MRALEKLREHERRSHPKHVPKVGTSEYGKWIWNRPDFLSFPKAPCQWLCQRDGLRRFHLTCLTCWLRRFTFQTQRSENLRKYKQIIMIMQSPDGKDYALPDSYTTYGIILPVNERGLVHPLKAGIVKVLMTIAERIAEF